LIFDFMVKWIFQLILEKIEMLLMCLIIPSVKSQINGTTNK